VGTEHSEGRRWRDLEEAITLRPKDVLAKYGINPATLSTWVRHPDAEKRLASYLVGGVRGGLRLVNREELERYLRTRRKGRYLTP
jgi:hypothetical protein